MKVCAYFFIFMLDILYNICMDGYVFASTHFASKKCILVCVLLCPTFEILCDLSVLWKFIVSVVNFGTAGGLEYMGIDGMINFHYAFSCAKILSLRTFHYFSIQRMNSKFSMTWSCFGFCSDIRYSRVCGIFPVCSLVADSILCKLLPFLVAKN